MPLASGGQPTLQNAARAAENKPTRRRVVAMAALRRWLAMHAAPAAAATTLRDLCPNKHFEATLEDIDDDVLRGPPYDDVRDQLALRHATEGRKGLEIGGPTPPPRTCMGYWRAATTWPRRDRRPSFEQSTRRVSRDGVGAIHHTNTHTGSRITSTGDAP